MSQRIDQVLARASELRELSETAILDLQLLLERVLDKPRSYLYTWPERLLTAPQQQLFEALLQRRKNGEPIAYLLGFRDFWTLTLEVNASTLIPRPETELLVELALDLLAEGPRRVADLGTGTGAVALSLASERPGWEVSAVEYSAAAARLAERNRARLELTNVEVLTGSWCQPLTGHFDLILSNPPYIDPKDPHLELGDVRFEPRSALVAEERGLADIRLIVEQARSRLKPAGWLLLEHGYDQGEAVRQLLRAAGYAAVHTHRDLAQQDRVTVARLGEALCP
ncbi:MAG: release factor glutamine methyltransferase [Motiliproteus sp.]|jgi:release factor glutamine methyltransferase